MSLTPQQLRLLNILNAYPGQISKFTGQDVVDTEPTGVWMTPQAVHQTASSLSRRGLVIKHPTHGRGSISYSISTAGKNALKEAAKPRSRIKRSKT